MSGGCRVTRITLMHDGGGKRMEDESLVRGNTGVGDQTDDAAV